ncbi:allantoinase AllB [Virgibacillus sp. W0430]|uniref:allantoinase AllB n=1 Tax=Virgibacillus sp. W0430 TaxID=3391580 RepID=UPI003F46D152
MHWDHIVTNGHIVTSTSDFVANIYIKDGKIAAISNEALDGEAKEVTDAAGRYVLPGLIDTHVHSRDGGATHKEDFFHSTQAAAAGGITTIFEMPNTNPTINNAENFHKQVENLLPKAHVNFGLWGICLGDVNINDFKGLHQAGVIGFKYFWGYAVHKQTFQLQYNYSENMDDVFPPCSDGEVYDMFKEVAKTGQTIAIHAENSELINRLTSQAKFEERNDYHAFLATRPNLAEELTIQTGIAMAKATGARLHILHVSTAEGVELIKQAQLDGYPITAETCPHYLFLTNEDYKNIGPSMKVYPLVKYKKDQDRIWQGIMEGTISFVCSDHAPHTEEEKSGDLHSIPAGMCGVETLVPLMLNEVSNKRISMKQLVCLLAENPAKQFGVFPKKGAIQVGADADLTIVDMDKKSVIKREKLHSKSKVTAYDGFNIQGMPVQTIVNGITVMKDGTIQSKPVGQCVTPVHNNL